MFAVVACCVGAVRAEQPTKSNDQAVVSPVAAPKVGHPFYKTGTDVAEDFAAVLPSHAFEVVNNDMSHMMLAFEWNRDVSVSPKIVHLVPGERATAKMSAAPGVKSFALSYAVARGHAPFETHTNRYRAYRDGETVMCVPVSPELRAAMKQRAEWIFGKSKTLVTDPAMPPDSYIHTPGPAYRTAGLFARDFLFQLEGAGRDTVTAEEVKLAVDYLLLKQLTENKVFDAFTFPKGAIPDHIYPAGDYSWGPGGHSAGQTGHFHRPSMDEAFCFVTLAWHYGYKAGWDAAWQSWFTAHRQRFVDAWNSAPRNPKTGLVTQWTTEGHIGANGITETTGPCVIWGFHDSFGFPGDNPATSVLACNAARALADMYDYISDGASAKQWSDAADAMRDAIRAQFNPVGYLPWGIGPGAPTMASPDVTGYAVWSGILTDEQADAASDWLANRYIADRTSGGAADLFHMTSGFRGAVRMVRKVDDVYPGVRVWPRMTAPHWDDLKSPYNVYQNGAYWYYMSLGIATTLHRKHPAEAQEWVANAYADITTGDTDNPFERIDGDKPANDRYNASAGQMLGMGMPAEMYSTTVTIATAGDSCVAP